MNAWGLLVLALGVVLLIAGVKGTGSQLASAFKSPAAPAGQPGAALAPGVTPSAAVAGGAPAAPPSWLRPVPLYP